MRLILWNLMFIVDLSKLLRSLQQLITTEKLSDLNQRIIFETCSQQTNYIWLI